MPSAANAKSEKPASSEAMDNSPIRQIMTIIEHKIRNLEKRKSKLTSYRDLQKAGRELNTDQKVAVAKYDEVAQTLEFARDLSKQVTAIATSAEREAKKQAKKEAWVRYAAETNKIREVLLILDCLNQMGSAEARNDFLNGTNGAVKLTEADLKILDDVYPEVTPKHELNEEGQPGFHIHTTKAAEHLYAIIDGKPKEILGTTYTHIKEIVSAVHDSGYFDRSLNAIPAEIEETHIPISEVEPVEVIDNEVEPEVAAAYAPAALPVPPAPTVVPAPAYPLRPLPPITLQEVEHAYFAQQYPQQRPIAEVIGSQNFFFLQESEIDSPVGTPQPPPIPNQPSPPAPIPTQTFTNQHFVQLPGGRVAEPGTLPMPPQPHFPPHPEHAGYQPAAVPLQAVPAAHPHVSGLQPVAPMQAVPPPAPQPVPTIPLSAAPHQVEDRPVASPADEKHEDENKESGSPDRDEGGERKIHGQGDGQARYRRYGGRVGGGSGRGAPNGHRGRGAFQNRQGNEGYRGRHPGEYQGRSGKDGYQNRQYDGYQNRHKDGYQSRGGDDRDGYYGNGDTGDSHQQNENGGRDRYNDNQNYQGGFKGRGRGGPRGGARGATRPPRPQQYSRKPENVE
ncbi:cell cycle associated protein caprin family member [Anticarsia gemmatalis]|uniref:cell cycle associated protein caprin family member n=1 Tax=Anticarsia gemmatalis TaxID=129554 RepID=UPI003F768A38